MKGLADVVIALADLAEAEGELLRRNIIKLVNYFSLTILSLVFAITSLGFIIFAFYQAMLVLFGPIVGPLTTGTVGLLSGGLVLWLGHLRMR